MVQGLALLTVQAHYPSLLPPVCNVFKPPCEKVGGGNAALLFIALYILAAGGAGVKATLPSHGADQFDETDPKETREMSSFFNLLLLALCLGGVISLTLIVWIQDNRGWDWGFGFSTIAMFLGVIVFFSGLPMYRIQAVRGTSALLEIIQVSICYISIVMLRTYNYLSTIYVYDDRDKHIIANKLCVKRISSILTMIPSREKTRDVYVEC